MTRRGQQKQQPRGDWRSKQQRNHAGIISKIGKINPDKMARHDVEGLTNVRLARLRLRSRSNARKDDEWHSARQ